MKPLRSAVTRVLMMLMLAAMASPASASALDDGGGRWLPGRILVAFDSGDAEEINRLVHEAVDGKVVGALPVIPHAWQIEVPGKVQEDIDRLVDVEHRPGRPRIRWIQPNYIAHVRLDASPREASFWPNDPYFWPSRFDNPNSCPENQSKLQQFSLWPLGYDLRSPQGFWNLPGINPLPPEQRLPPHRDAPQPLSAGAHSSIDVLPVWNALGPARSRTQGKSASEGDKPVWTDGDMRRSGIAVWDTGISDAPDLQSQVAAVFGVGHQPQRARDMLSLAYEDAERVEDFFRVEKALNPKNALDIQSVLGFYEPHGRLVTEDDLGSLEGFQQLPTGCDGHGTQVASVAAATAGNGQGIAGVGWNVPLIAIRAFAHYDSARGLKTFPETALDDAKRFEVRVTDATLVQQLAIVKTLELPVVNMSWGAQLFSLKRVTTPLGRQEERVIVSSPAVVEAMGRLFSDGTTLGVAAAGDGKYGSVGALPRTASLDERAPAAVQAPCGLRMLPELNARIQWGIEQRPFKVKGVDFRKLNLICVTSSSSTRPWVATAVATGAGSGAPAVDLTAPGINVPVATRPIESIATRGLPTPTYRAASGTSYAAAAVSGAAALLREAAPGADIGDIARALRAGARINSSLLGKVRYGQLDVACSALWLSQHERPQWRLRIDAQELKRFTNHCFKRVAINISEWMFPKSSFGESTKRFDTGANLIRNLYPFGARAEGVAEVQENLLKPDDREKWANSVALFPIGTLPFTRPTAPPGRPIYDFGKQAMGCPEDFRLLGVAMRWRTWPHPTGYMIVSGDTTSRSIWFNIAMIKPWWWELLPNEMRVQLKLQCEYVPPLG